MPEAADLERRTTELLQRLIRFDTVNPPGNEQAAQEWLRGLLEAAGFECELLPAVEGRANQVATLKADSDGPSLVLLGHVDTVLADPADWTADPWSGELRDGCVWGRGALDMKSQVAAEAAAAIALAEEGWRPASGELKLVFTADEEAGAEFGAQYLCREHADKVRGDIVVNEGGGDSFVYGDRKLYTVAVAEKGVFRYTLTAKGAAGHASVPRIGDNALVKLAPALEALREGRPTYEANPEADALLSAMGLDPSDPAAAVAELERVDPRIAVLVEPLLGVTMAPTMISASQKINVIPAKAQLKVDCRVPPELGRDHALERIEAVVGHTGDFEISFDEQVVGNRSRIDTPLMGSIQSFLDREDPGAKAAPLALTGFSDSCWFRAAFPDCIAYGFFPMKAMDTFEATPLIHGADERIPVEDLGLAARFYSDIVQEVLG